MAALPPSDRRACVPGSSARARTGPPGAKQDGGLRHHQIGPDGTLRDTVVFSILAAEWPTVRLALGEKLAGAASTVPAGS